jgi:hypothetical protein
MLIPNDRLVHSRHVHVANGSAAIGARQWVQFCVRFLALGRDIAGGPVHASTSDLTQPTGDCGIGGFLARPQTTQSGTERSDRRLIERILARIRQMTH